MADIVERYPAGSTTANYTGNNLTDVQTYSGAATGDVIKVSQDITVSTTIGNGATSGYSVGSFTLQGASSENPVTISGGTRLYNLPNTVTEFTLKDVTISGFVNSDASGGAIRVNGPITINLENVTFKNNKENKHHGGGISRDNMSDLVTIVGDNLTFDGNYAKTGGGAIRCVLDISGKNKNSVITFNKNSSGSNGAIVTLGSSDDMESVFSTGTFYFTNNTGKEGGAIFAVRSLTFSGDTTAYFQNNKVSGNGNDIYLQSQNSSELTFKDAGNYSFDGGIYLANANQKTIIDKAQVTIAGRENDTTNNYVLRSVTISNGGKLTANLDYIDSLTGIINLSNDNNHETYELVYNVDTAEKTLDFTNANYVMGNGDILKTGEGRLKINTEQLTGDLHFTADNFVVSSGPVDIKGYMYCNLSVEGPDAVFSPGNSVGDAVFGGGFILKEGATLLIEQDSSGIDTLTASSFNIDSNSIIDIAADSLQPGASYDIIFQTDSEGNPIIFTEAQATDDYWNNLLTPESAYYWNLSVSGNIVRASVDSNAVPEPSTWALLALGVCGLLYLRKRVRN